MIARIILFALYFTSASNTTVTRIPSTGTPPTRRLYPVGTYLNGKFYTFGGKNTSGKLVNTLHAFHLDTQLWERLEPIDDISPAPRMVFAMYSTDSKIFVHGGHGPNGNLTDLWSYDPLSKSWTKAVQKGEVPPPFIRSGFTDFAHNDITYFVISCFATEEVFASDELYIYDSSTETWRKMPKVAKSGHKVPPARRMCNINYYDGFVYLWGGELWEDNEGSQLYRYDLSLEQWEAIKVTGKLPQTRSFTSSGVYKNALYVMPGWVDPWEVDVNDIFRFDFKQLENPGDMVWEEMVAQEMANQDEFLFRDAYAARMVDNNFYMHGGYSHLGALGNYLSRLDLSKSPIGITVYNQNIDIPSPRYFSTLTLISGKFYMYGGSMGTEELDELWIYDVSQGTWELKNDIGIGPGLRQGHSAAAIGNSLMIWGGRYGSNFYQDLHMYNTLTNIWEEVQVKSTINPSGAEGACMEVYNDDLYLFGGKNEFNAHNVVWKFNLGTNEYQVLSDGTYKTAAAAAYADWYAMGSKMYILNGIMDNTGSPHEIKIFDLETNRWTDSEMEIELQRSGVASGKAGQSIIIANGSLWNSETYRDVYVLDTNTNQIEKVYDNEWGTFAEASVYYKNSLYLFGGGNAQKDGAIMSGRSVNRFYTINFPDLPCSVGTYFDNDECIPCPKGTYKDTYGPEECVQCSRGMYNEEIGATNIKACIPCPEGTFTAYLGQEFCIKCSTGQFWPAGTVKPEKKSTHGNQFTDVQPTQHESLEDFASHWALQALIYMILLATMMLFIILFNAQLRQRITQCDIFYDKHNHSVPMVMKTRTTLIGGLASFLVYGTIIFLTIQALLYYFYDNIEEVKSLIPIVVLNEFVDTVKGKMTIEVRFSDYGGQCVTEENECMPEITYTKANMKGYFSKLSCETDGNICAVQLTCNKCILDTAAQILFSSRESNSHATSINVEVSSQSSVPNFDSEITINQFVQDGGVFRGPDPTVFHFQAIPSLFESEISNEVQQETGYHLALGSSSEQGSSYTVENLAKTRFLHTQITFTQGYSALLTKRTYKIRAAVLVIAIMGGIAGSLNIAVALMKYIEKRFERCQKRWKSKEQSFQMKIFNKGLFTRELSHIQESQGKKDDVELEGNLHELITWPNSDNNSEINSFRSTHNKTRNHLRSNWNMNGYDSVNTSYAGAKIIPDSRNESYQDTDRLRDHDQAHRDTEALASYEDESLDYEEISVVVIPN